LIKRQRIFITGRVQGVGFRPAVYSIARKLGLSGFVYNDTKGVTIELQGKEKKIDEFLVRLQSRDKPPLAEIKSCKTVDIALIKAEDKFIIETSDSQGTALSEVTADIATCRDCLTEMAEKKNFRYGYPFINCTNCGPRYSIVKSIPYDRPNTTMSEFAMCDKCAAQYTDVTDRRFHAQPVACGTCGPKIRLTDSKGNTIKTRTDEVIAETARLLLAGKVVAIKGIGGFHLAVDALNNKAVERLRERKRRDHKPFAMMADSIDRIKEYAIVSGLAEQVLKSPQSPIVLLPKKKNSAIAPSVASGVDTFGFMLCYAPLHYLLFAQNIEILVKNTFCFGKQNQLICSEHIGDLEDAEVYHHYINSIEHLRKLFEVEPKVVACDLHPGYLSTQYALSLSDLRVIQVQHHWAHIASVLVEHGLNGPVIGIAADGTGYGTDGAIWGCECLIASMNGFERFGHLAYYPLAGADAASKEAIRPVIGLLKKTYGNDFKLQKFGWLLDRIEADANKQQIILEQIEKRINTVETSSLGRVFDVVAAMLGLGSYNHFEAQLPMALEAVAAADVEVRYELEMFSPPGEPCRFGLGKTIRQLVSDVRNKVHAGIISAKFHNTISEILLGFALVYRSETDLNTVALSGGVFCNRYLTNRLIKQLKQNDFHVLFNRNVPSNDGGISVGQAAIAAKLVNRVS